MTDFSLLTDDERNLLAAATVPLPLECTPYTRGTPFIILNHGIPLIPDCVWASPLNQYVLFFQTFIIVPYRSPSQAVSRTKGEFKRERVGRLPRGMGLLGVAAANPGTGKQQAPECR